MLIVVKSHIMSLSLGFGKYFNNLNNQGFIVFFEIVELTLKLVWKHTAIVELLWKLALNNREVVKYYLETCLDTS